VTGNLTVLGTTTTVDTDNLRVKDPIIELGKDNTASPIVDLGLILTRPTGNSNVAIIFDESTDKLEIGYTQSNASDTDITMQTAAANPISVNVNGTISGDGSGLTALNATNIASGTLDAARIPTLNQNTTGSAGSAATLTTPRSIGGVNFDGSVAIVPTTFNGATFSGDVTVDSTTFHVDSTNNRVGIGTTNPAQKLHVSNVTSGGVTSLLVSNPNGAINASAALKLGVSAEDNNVAKFGIIHERKSTYGGGDTYFCTNYATDTTEVSESDMAMTILGSNKNVGIGTTSPLSELDLYKATGGAELLINTGDLVPPTIRLWNIDHNNYNNHAAGTSVGTINFSGNERLNGDTHTDDTRAFSYANTLYDWARISALFVGSTSTSTSQGYVRGDLAFYTNNGNASASDLQERMRIKHNGNVGIGTTDPSSTLEVHGTGIHMQGTVLRALSAIGTVASGAYVKLCDFSALSASSDGVCAITIRWGSGTGGGTYYYWQGHAAGIVSFNTYSDGAGTFNSSGSEPLTLNHHYHYRTVGPLTFIIDSDNANASYGRHSIYVAPNAAIDSMSFEVIALPLRR
jgi:hypothetical protein